MTISESDVDGTSVESYLRTIDDSTASIKGHVRISKKSDSSAFMLFAINGSSSESGTVQDVRVSHLSSSSASIPFGRNDLLIVTFTKEPAMWVLLGPQGSKGQKGAQGAQGATSPQGPQGATGQKGAQGAVVLKVPWC